VRVDKKKITVSYYTVKGKILDKFSFSSK